MKKDQERLDKQLTETQAENRRLQEPLQKVKQVLCMCTYMYNVAPVLTLNMHPIQARDEVTELQKQLANYERDKVSLAVSIYNVEIVL